MDEAERLLVVAFEEEIRTILEHFDVIFLPLSVHTNAFYYNLTFFIYNKYLNLLN